MKKNNLKFKTNKRNQGLAVYPSETDLSINATSLKLELRDFKKAIQDELNIPSFITLLSLWTVLLTSTFKDVFGGAINGHDLYIVYFIITVVLSVYSLKSIILITAKLLFNLVYFFNKSLYFQKWLYKYETNPEKKAEKIIEKCGPKYQL